MKNLFSFFVMAYAVSVAAAPKIRAVYTVPGELDDIVGHVQGAACSTQGVYLSHAEGIYKIGWDGRLIRKCRAPGRLGDVGYSNGCLYGAFSLREPIDGKKGMIRVWDEDLNVVDEHLLPEKADGCAVLGDTIYYGVDVYGSEPHRRCRIGRLTLEFRDLGVADLDMGGQCRRGVQTMATDGQSLFCGYDPSGTPSVTCARFPPNLGVCDGTPRLECAAGFDLLPQSVFPSEHPRFFTVRALGGDSPMWHSITNPAQVRLDFHEYRKGRFFDVTERLPPPPITRNDFRASAPFVYADRPAKLYRMYLPTRDTDGFGVGVQMRTSTDFLAWSVARQVLRVPARRQCSALSAPEMHAYKGRYYMFATLDTPAGRRLWIYRADSPEGPFREWSDGAIPSSEWSAWDGTFWVEEGRPYMVFCQGGPLEREGRVCAVALTDNLRRAAGKPFELFRASACPEAVEGPFLFRSHNNSLLMIWSSSAEAEGGFHVARSASGKLAGPWEAPARISGLEGGHGMLFNTRHNQLMLCLHHPNAPEEKRRARILSLQDLGNSLRIAK